jgi:membrane protease subunit HflK
LRSQASAYAGRVIPEARGEGDAILERAKGYRVQTIAEATGQAARFVKVLKEYEQAVEISAG